jgi:hypothetical protein
MGLRANKALKDKDKDKDKDKGKDKGKDTDKDKDADTDTDKDKIGRPPPCSLWPLVSGLLVSGFWPCLCTL